MQGSPNVPTRIITYTNYQSKSLYVNHQGSAAVACSDLIKIYVGQFIFVMTFLLLDDGEFIISSM
jgi:hypothetical protein